MEAETPWESLVRLGLYAAAVFQLACIAAVFLWPRAQQPTSTPEPKLPPISEMSGGCLMKASAEVADKEKPWKMMAATSFVLLMLCIGVPLWWSTTSVRREPLPYSTIDALAARPLPLPLAINLLYLDDEGMARANAAKASLLSRLNSRESQPHPRLQLRPQIKVQAASRDIKGAVDAAKDFAQLTAAAASGLSLVFLPSTAPRAPAPVFLGSGRLGYVSGAPDLFTTISNLYLSRDEMGEIIERLLKERRMQSSGERLWSSGVVEPAISVDLYLINPDPAGCPGPRGWDLRRLVNGPLQAIKDRLAHVSDITFTSQTLYTVDWAKHPRKGKNGFTLSESELPHLINPMEAFISSQETSKPVFNILVYATPPHTSPLFIVDKDGEPVEDNAFLIASWGGVVVLNECPAALPPSLLHPLANIIQSFFAASPNRLPRGVGSSRVMLSDWELDRLGLLAVVENAIGTGATLSSLTRLLSQIHNIVIDDKVASGVRDGVGGLEACLAALEVGDVPTALDHSKKAVTAAETAFFHPALLKLLYFPDDQKYAIYIPLFLPVGLPVLFSLKLLLRHFTGTKIKTD